MLFRPFCCVGRLRGVVMATKRQKPIARESTSGYGGGEIVLYRATDGAVRLDVRLER